MVKKLTVLNKMSKSNRPGVQPLRKVRCHGLNIEKELNPREP